MISNKFLSKKNIFFIIVNAFLALALFFIIQKIYFLPGSDSSVFFYGPVIKEKILKKESLPNSKDFLFVNTHYDNMLVDNMSQGFPMGNISIVDRNKLGVLFNKINRLNSHKYIICDIFFQDESSYDDSLSNILNKVKNIIIPRKDNIKSTKKPFRNINSGIVDAFTVGGTFYKYKLFNQKSGIKSIPLKMYEELNNTSYIDYNLFGSLNGKLVFNDFVPEYKIDSYNVFQTNDYPVFNLGELIKVTDNFDKFIKDKIIIIGNFNSDTKNTIYGNIPGPLIILNSYLSIENQDNKITFFLILFLLLIFSGFSYFIVLPKDKIESIFLKIPVFGGLLFSLSYVLTMSIFTLVIYFIFGNNLSLTYLAIIFYFENLIFHRKYYLTKWKEKINS